MTEYKEWSKYSDSAFEFSYPSDVDPELSNIEHKISFEHSNLKEGQIPPFFLHVVKEILKEPQSLEQYTRDATKQMAYLLKDHKANSDFPGKITETTLAGLRAKEMTFTLTTSDPFLTYSVWTVDGGHAYTVVFQTPSSTHAKLKEMVCKRFLKSLVFREANWQDIILEPHIVKGAPYALYLPRDATQIPTSTPSMVKFVFSNGEKNFDSDLAPNVDAKKSNKKEALMSLAVYHAETNYDDPKKLIKKEDVAVSEKVMISRKFNSYQVSKKSGDLCIWEAYMIVEGMQFRITFTAKKNIVRVKTILLWTSILDQFTFDNLEHEHRLLYINFYDNYQVKFPPLYKPLSGSGHMSVRLLHSIKGVTYSISCFDQQLDDVIDSWKIYNLITGDVEVKDAPSYLGHSAKEVLNAKSQSHVIPHNDKIYSITQKVYNYDEKIIFNFFEPSITYELAKKTVNDICPPKKQTSCFSKLFNFFWFLIRLSLVFMLMGALFLRFSEVQLEFDPILNLLSIDQGLKAEIVAKLGDVKVLANSGLEIARENFDYFIKVYWEVFEKAVMEKVVEHFPNKLIL